jgi:hypothetical protein
MPYLVHNIIDFIFGRWYSARGGLNYRSTPPAALPAISWHYTKPEFRVTKRLLLTTPLLLAAFALGCADRILAPDSASEAAASMNVTVADGELFRVGTSPVVYLSYGGARYAVPDVATLYACTGSFPGIVRTVTTMPALVEGPALPQVTTNEWMSGAVPVKADESAAVYVVVGCVKSAINDLATLVALFGEAPPVASVPQQVLNHVPTGPAARTPLRRSGTLIQGPGTAEVRWVTFMGGALAVASGEALDSYCRFGADRIPESVDAAEWAAYPSRGILDVSAANCELEQPPIVRDGEIYRIAGQSALYLSQQGRAYAIPDMPTLAVCTGGHTSVVRTLPRAPALRDGGVLPSVLDHPWMAGDMAVRSEGHPAVFAVIGCARSAVPDPDTFFAVFGPSGANRTATVPDAVLASVPRTGSVRLPLRKPGTLIRTETGAEIRWVVYVGGALAVENIPLLAAHCRTAVVVVSPEEFAAYPARARLEAPETPACAPPPPPALQPDYRLPLPGGLAWQMINAVGQGNNVGIRYYAADFLPFTEGLPGQPPQQRTDVPVIAAAEGTVGHIGLDAEYGVWIMIHHRSGLSTIYAHLQPGSVRVLAGQSVVRGQELARMGSSGNTADTRLHFELRRFEEGGGSVHAPVLDQIVLEGTRFTALNAGAFYLSSNPVIFAPAAAHAVVTAPVRTIDVGAQHPFAAAGFASNFSPMATGFTWSSSAPTVAAVNEAGIVTGVEPGTAWIIAATCDVRDSVRVAVAGPATVIGTAYVAGDPAEVRPAAGQLVTVNVELDRSRVSPNGDLGAAQFKLFFDPAFVDYESMQVIAGGVGNLANAGEFSFAYASTEPTGTARTVLATVTFRTRAGLPAGAVHDFRLQFTEAPVATNFTRYSMPLTLGGRLRVWP